MQKNTISIWHPNSPTISCSFLYRKEHEIAFLHFLNTNNLNPKKIFTISPNSYHIEVLCLFYAAELSGAVSDVQDPTIALIDDINSGIENRNLYLAEQAANKISIYWQGKEEKLFNFFQIKKKIISKIISPSEWEPPFTIPKSINSHKQWWRSAPERAAEIDEILKELKSHFPGAGPDFSEYENWLKSQHKKISSLHAKGRADRLVALTEASAYFMTIAEKHLHADRNSLAILFCHRAADLLLMKLCDEQNLIDYKNPKPVYKYTPPSTKSTDIHFRSSYRMLEQNGIASDPNRKKCFDDLNDLRNHLMYTHYLGKASRQNSNKILHDTKKFLKKLGGNTWEAALKEHCPPPSISMKLLFEAHPFFKSSIFEISLDDLKGNL